MGARLRRCCTTAWAYRSTFTMILTPLILLVLLPLRETMGVTPEACNCLYVLLLMAIYWMSEAIPISATALIPTVLLPLTGVMKAGNVATCYQKDTIMLLIGGFLMATAVESSGVHKRLSIIMLRLAGSNMRFLILGFMIPTWFLSMWISNTAATAMMVPIVQAVISELDKGARRQRGVSLSDAVMGEVEVIGMTDLPIKEVKSTANLVKEETPTDEQKKRQTASSSERWVKVGRALSLCICYASTIGGLATLTGTPTNIILIESLEGVSLRHGNYNFNLNFFSWMVLGVPLSAVLLLVCWILLQMIFIGLKCTKENEDQGLWIRTIVQEEYNNLPSFTFNEGAVVAHLVLLVGLWVAKDPGNVGGWDRLFKPGYVSDATVALLVGLLLFAIPRKRPKFLGGTGSSSRDGSQDGCLTWKAVHEKLPWGVVILLGGGFALAEAVEVSGLSDVISGLFDVILKELPHWALIVVICSITTLVTQLTSNMTVATLFLPIIGLVAENSRVHPLYLMLPACFSTSFAFTLPVSSPSNAIVFASGILRVKDMVISGLALSIIGILLITLMTMTFATSYYGLDTFPYNVTTNITSQLTTQLTTLLPLLNKTIDI